MRKKILFNLFLMITAVALAAEETGSSQRAEAALQAMKKATSFMRSLSTEGGYLWNYSPEDLSQRAGENMAPLPIIWFSDHDGTPMMGEAYIEAWNATGEQCFLDASREVVSALAHCQLESGGWHYSGSFDPELALNKDGALDYKGVRAQKADPERTPYPLYVIQTTFDDDATQYCTRFLIEHVAATQRLNDPKDDLARQTLSRALNGMFRAQYPNGAWPERYDGSPRNPADYPVKAAKLTDDWPRHWPSDREGEYMNYYTLNDRVMRDCISTMLLAWKRLGREDCLASAKRGGDFLILSQFPEPQPGWAQQYDANMQPGWGRPWEVPGITSQESRTALQGLLELYLVIGDEKYLKPIAPAVAWLERSRIAPDKWSRYYEIGSNRPIYGTNDGEITTVVPQTGYSWQSAFHIPEFIEKYNHIMRVGRDAWNANPRVEPEPEWSAIEARVDRIVSDLDAQGRWLTKGALARKQPVLDKMISVREFSKNMLALSDYLRKENVSPSPAGNAKTEP